MRPHRPGILAVILTLAAAGPLRPQPAPRPSEYEVKAAYLYHFGKFVKWPEGQSPRSPFVIAVIGEDPFGGVLDRTLAGKTLLDRPVEIRRIGSADAANKAQILFIASSEKGRVAEILSALRETSVLTVGDMDGFADRGGMIAFKLNEEFVRFDINLDQVKRAGLKMSSQLIRLARRVISKDDGA